MMEPAEELAAKTLYVGNLAAGSNEALLRIIFEQCGPIASIRIAGRPDFDTCFAFVEFMDRGHAEFAKAMDGLNVGDRNLKVSTAKASSLARHFDRIVRNAPSGASIPLIQAQAQARVLAAGLGGGAMQSHHDFSFGNGGLSFQDSLQPPNYGAPQLQPQSRPHMRPPPQTLPQQYSAPGPMYPESQPFDLPGPPYPTSRSQPGLSGQYLPPSQRLTGNQPPGQMAFRQRNQGPTYPNHSQRFVRPRQDPVRVERTVFVENVGDEVNEQDLADHFGVCGDVTAVRIVNGESRKAWLEFSSQRGAKAAREYDQTSLRSNIIRVRPSKTAIHTNGLRQNFSRQRSVSPRRDRGGPPSGQREGNRLAENGHLVVGEER